MLSTQAADRPADATVRPYVLIVDDDATVRDVLEEFLCLRGVEVGTADGGTALRRRMDDRPADLVLLDLNMPGEDGLSLARYLREHTTAAIVMLTSAAETVDRIVGLELGADDYLTKPFDLREVLARIRSVLRRVAPPSVAPVPAAAPDLPEQIPFGRFVLNLSSHRLLADGEDVSLTNMEFDLLKVLATHPGKALDRQQLCRMAHGRDWQPLDRSLDIRITRLRQKLEGEPSRPRLIRTVRNIGYVFTPDDN